MAHKQNVISRMWNRLFHKTKLLAAPLQYTQKEVKAKMYEMLDFLDCAIEIKKKCAEKIEYSINTTSIYFYDKKTDEIENEFNTYMHTVCTKNVKLNGDSKLILSNPVTKSNILLEVYPVLNLKKTSRDKYIMNIYLNAIKIFARYTTKQMKISKNSTKTIMYNRDKFKGSNGVFRTDSIY